MDRIRYLLLASSRTFRESFQNSARKPSEILTQELPRVSPRPARLDSATNTSDTSPTSLSSMSSTHEGTDRQSLLRKNVQSTTPGESRPSPSNPGLRSHTTSPTHRSGELAKRAFSVHSVRGVHREDTGDVASSPTTPNPSNTPLYDSGATNPSSPHTRVAEEPLSSAGPTLVVPPTGPDRNRIPPKTHVRALPLRRSDPLR